jgi:hypothetical protein
VDPRRKALLELDALLAEPLSTEACAALPRLLSSVPGRTREVVRRLSDARTPAALDTLLALPTGTQGLIEGVFAGLAHGARRRFSIPDHVSPSFLALEFRRSRARGFAVVLETALRTMPDGVARLEDDGKVSYRFVVSGSHPVRSLPEIETSLRWLEPRISSYRRSRLWINGWCFAGDPIPRRAHRHLVQAWFQSLATRSP